MQPPSWKNLFLAGALTALGSCTGCCRCPPPPLLRPVLAWSPMRKHPCYRAGGHDALFGHRGTCWAPWPAEWIPCPEQACDTGLLPMDEFVPASPIGGTEGFQGPPEREPLPPPAMGGSPSFPPGGFSLAMPDVQPASFEVPGMPELHPGVSAPRPLQHESEFLR